MNDSSPLRDEPAEAPSGPQLPPNPLGPGQWGVQCADGVVEALEFSELVNRIRQLPGSISWNGTSTVAPIKLVAVPGQTLLQPLAGVMELRAETLAMLQRTCHSSVRWNYGFAFLYGFSGATGMLSARSAAGIFLVMAVQSLVNNLRLQPRLVQLRDDPDKCLREMAQEQVMECMPRAAADKSHWVWSPSLLLIAAWIGLFLIQMFVYWSTENHARPDILQAGLVKAMVGSEPWRLLTAALLHGSLFHLAMNAAAMLSLGRLFEMLAPRALLIPVWLCGALAGSVLSTLATDQTSVGASGGIMAVLGFLIAFGWVHRRELPGLATLLGESLLWTAAMGIAAWQLIDNAAHAGGLIIGVLFGLLARRTPTVERETQANDAQQPLRMLDWVGASAVLILTLFAGSRLFA